MCKYNRSALFFSFIGSLFIRFCIFFTISIFVFCISLQIQQYFPIFNILFNDINISAIPVDILILLAIGAFIMAFCVELVCSELFFPHIKYIWRLVIICFIDTVLFTVIALVFKWFPADNIYAWFNLFLYVTIINFFWCSTIIIKTKLQDRKDNKLLAKYKNLHKE